MTSEHRPDEPSSATPTQPRRDPEKESGGEHPTNVAGMMTGTALMFIGFLNVFLSISGGFEINIVPMIIYFGGLAIWAGSVIENPTIRYTVVTAAVAAGLAFLHYGEVLFWHKQVVFWSTVAIVTFFMFKTAPPDKR